MVNVLLVTHGILGLGLLASAERILGMESRIQVISFFEGEKVKTLQVKIGSELQKFSRGEVFIMTDIKGGIAWQACTRLPDKCTFTLLSGVNLPMLIEVMLLMQDVQSAAQLAEHVCTVKDRVQLTKK